MRKKTTKTETLGEAPAVIKVKQVGPYWIAGGKVTSDDGKTRISVPCGKGGVMDCTRERAIQWLIHDFGKGLAEFNCFENAKEILRRIEDDIQPKLF